MKKLLFIIFLIPSIAHAATFASVTPDIIKDMTVRWEYQFTFKSSPTSPPEIYNTRRDSCTRPIKHSNGKPLLPPPLVCFNTEAEARAGAQIEADAFEKKFIAVGHKTEDIEDWKVGKIKTIDKPAPAPSLWSRIVKKATGQ